MVDRISLRCHRCLAGGGRAGTLCGKILRHQLRALYSVVVEDNFVAGRPEWEVAGVQMVQDVLPWGTDEITYAERQPLPSSSGVSGPSAGYAHINECMEDEAFRQAARRLMLMNRPLRCVSPTLITPAAPTACSDCFANPALQHCIRANCDGIW